METGIKYLEDCSFTKQQCLSLDYQKSCTKEHSYPYLPEESQSDQGLSDWISCGILHFKALKQQPGAVRQQVIVKHQALWKPVFPENANLLHNLFCIIPYILSPLDL